MRKQDEIKKLVGYVGFQEVVDYRKTGNIVLRQALVSQTTLLDKVVQ